MADRLGQICADLQALQRTRAAIIKSRIGAENARRNFVANALGYYAGLGETEREAAFKKADAIIEQIVDEEIDHPTKRFVMASEVGISIFLNAQKETEKEMLPLAADTPAAEWVALPEQRGFGMLSLAVVIGECGDIRGYANPAKLWRRMGCAPWSFDGKTMMGGTWKCKGLPADEWSRYGYNPRRRSIAYILGVNILKSNYLKTTGGGERERDTEEQAAPAGVYIVARAKIGSGKRNARGAEEHPVTETPGGTASVKKPRGGEKKIVTDVFGAATGLRKRAGESEKSVATESSGAPPGPYRARYDVARAACAAAHPDYSKLRCQRHAMLLATKLLLKNLWKAWNPALDRGEWKTAPARTKPLRRSANVTR